MKKLLLLSIALCLSVAVLSQNNSEKLKFFQNYKAPKPGNAVANNFEFTKTFSPVVVEKGIMDEDIVIGNTRYDLQSNSMIPKRIHVWGDGTVAGVWTMGFDETAGYPGRGTGYNYMEADGTWGPIPTERVESVRTGWPTIAPWGPNGEIMVAHSGANTLIISKRETKGEGDWTEIELEGPAGGPGLLWPRIITSGANNETIHLIALTTPSANGGAIYEGQDGALLYYRSTDGAETWDPEAEILEGLGADYYPAHGGDGYAWAGAKGDVIAFVVGDGITDGIVMKSDDQGESWERLDYMTFPWGGGPVPDDTQNFGGGDGDAAVAIDNNGKVHVVEGRMIHYYEGGSGFYFPYTNGVIYWNEDLDAIDTTMVGHDVVNPTTLEENGYLAAKYDDVDSLLGEYASYYVSITSMPQISINQFDDIMVTYAAMTHGYESEGKNFRHVWSVISPDGGVTWDMKTDHTADVFHLFSECVFPSLASDFVNGMAHILYQTDNLPGIAVRFEEHGVTDNNMVYLPIPWVFTDVEEQYVNTLGFVAQNYPNPASDQTMVQVSTLQRAELKMVITNVVGKKVAEINKGDVDAGVHYFNVDVSDLSEGLYLYTIYSGNNAETKKMIVE